MKLKKILSAAISALLIGGGASAADTYLKQEMRSAWLATVWGLDWPATTGTSASVIATQKTQLTTTLDRLKAAGMNAVSFQVRSMGDAMYKSSYEPWSRFLTGSRGTAPSDSSWDPLAFCVEECHKRGMECHAWVNPFRFGTGSSAPSTSLDKVATSSGWILSYTNSSGSTTHIYDPGNAGARARIVAVCKEIISNYDVDGLMFDDYFYPEGMPLGSGYDYNEWKASGSTLTQANWRRNNVRIAIKEVYAMIQSVKPHVRFGLSPAGVGGGPSGEAAKVYGLPKCYGGYDWMYNGIYCDPLPWLADKSIDYISPQIYWTTSSTANPYEPIAKWWSEVAEHFGRHFYSSHSLENFASTNTTAAWSERCKQIDINRQYTENDAPGSIFYSVKFISGRAGGAESSSPDATGFGNYLVANSFKVKALTPAMPWKTAKNPGMVSNLARSGNNLTWQALSGMRYVAYAVPETLYLEDAMSSTGKGLKSEYMIDVCYGTSVAIPEAKRSGYWYAVTAYDRYSNEWEPATLGAPAMTYDPVTDPGSDTLIVGEGGETISLKNIWIRSNVHGNPLRLKSDNNYNRDFVVRPADGSQTDDVIYVTDCTSISLPADCSLQCYDAATGERLEDLPLNFGSGYSSVGYTNLNGVTLDDGNQLIVHNLKIGDNPLLIGRVNPSNGNVYAVISLTTGNSDRIDHADLCGRVTSGNQYVVFAASADSNTIYRWVCQGSSVVESSSVVVNNTIGTAPRVIALSENMVMVNGASSNLMVYSFPQKWTTSIAGPSAGTATRANGGALFSHGSTMFMLTPEQSYDPGFRFRLFHGASLPYVTVSDTDALLPSGTTGLGSVNPPSGDYGCIATYYKFGRGEDEVTRFYIFANNNGMAAYELVSPRISGVESVADDAHAAPVVNGRIVDLGCVAESARIFDTKGSIVASGRQVSSLEVGTPGMYVLRMIDDRGDSVTKKIMVE